MSSASLITSGTSDQLYDSIPKYGTISGNDDNVQGATKSRTGAHWSRWYVLFVFALANILNNFLWATWGPISGSAMLIYGWSENTLFWVVNAGNITGFLFVLLGCYLVELKGKYLITFFHVF